MIKENLIAALIVFLSLIGLLNPGTSAYAQTYSFSHSEVESKLPYSQIRAICQAPDGVLWIGTYEGLMAYDGVELHKYTSSDSLAEDWVTSIDVGQTGDLWIGHWGGGVTHYDAKTKRFTEIDIKGFNAYAQVNDILEAPDGKVWVATEGSGITIYDPVNNEHSSAAITTGSRSRNVNVLCLGPQGNMWVGTEQGIIVSDPSTHEQLQRITMDDGLPGNSVRTLTTLANSDMAIGTNDGALVVKISGNRISRGGFIRLDESNGLPDPVIRCLIQDANQNLWVGTRSGLCRYDYQEGNFQRGALYTTESGLNYDQINTLLVDRENNLWIGTNVGLNIFQGEAFRIYREADGIANNIVWSVFADSRRDLWLGTYTGISRMHFGGDYQSKPEIENFTVEDGLSGNSVQCIFEDQDGNMWFGTQGGGACKYMVEEGRFVRYDTLGGSDLTVYDINQDNAGKMYFGTREGAIVYDPKNDAWSRLGIEDGLGGSLIYRIFKDKQGRMWFAPLGGNLSYMADGEFFTLDKNDGILHPFIHSITEDGLGNLWFGTYGGGLYCYNKEQEVSRLTTKDGLSSNSPFSILSDDQHYIWVGTNQGLDRIDLETKEVKHYGSDDGFLGVETNSDAICKDSRGNLWVGTIMGVLQYNPAKDESNTMEPLTRIQSVQINYREVALSNDTVLASDQNNMIFEFVGVSLSNPGKVKYRYSLKGSDSDTLIDAEGGRVNFTNLPPGDYTFEVYASNNDGVWNEQPASWSFRIAPPFWMTWWFLLLLFFLAIAIVFGIDRYRTQNLLDAKKILETKVTQRTHELDLKNNELAFKNRNITDSIKYAKRIQDAILPKEHTFSALLPRSFVFYKPKEIVSGDFYWVEKLKDKVWVSVLDSTGHGVPGAFLSILGYNGLNRALKEYGLKSPNEILERFNLLLEDALWYKDQQQNDGIDIGLVSIDRETGLLEYAGANIPMYIARPVEPGEDLGDQKVTMPANSYKLIEVRPDNHAIGLGAQKTAYKNHQIQLQERDTVYLFTNGFADQFGGERGKKFKMNRLKQLLLYNQDKTMSEQGVLLEQTFDEWRGDLEQIDDVCMIGLRWFER